MLFEDLPQAVVCLFTGEFLAYWRGDLQLSFTLRTFSKALVHREGVRPHRGAEFHRGGLVASDRIQCTNIRRCGCVLRGEHRIEGIEDGGLAGLIITVDENHAGIRNIPQREVLHAAHIVNDKFVDAH